MMKKVKFTLIIPLIFFIVSCSSRNYEDNFYSIFVITASSPNRFDNHGTAFKIEGNKVLTNAHVVSYSWTDGRIIHESIIGRVYNSHNSIAFEVYRIDYNLDIAILVPIDNIKVFSQLPSLILARNNYDRPGNSIFTIGNLNGFGLSFNRGYVSSRLKYINNNGVENLYLQTSIEISNGSSGAPVFNSNHEVIGIMTFRIRDNNFDIVPGMRFAIPNETIRTFISS